MVSAIYGAGFLLGSWGLVPNLDATFFIRKVKTFFWLPGLVAWGHLHLPHYRLTTESLLCQMTLPSKRTLCAETSELVEAAKTNGTFVRHAAPGNSCYNLYTTTEATVYEFLEDDYMIPTLIEDTIEVRLGEGKQDDVKRFVEREDDALEEDEDGSILEVVRGPVDVLVTKPWSSIQCFSGSVDEDSVKERMTNESCCLIDDALSEKFIDMISKLPISMRMMGPADVRRHREFSLHVLCKSAIKEYFERISGLELEDVDVVGREMQAGSYEILNDSAGMQNTLYVISTICCDKSLEVSGGVTRFLDADGEELVNYIPKHGTMFMVYASSELIRVYTELVKQCTSPFRQVIFKCTTK